MPPSAERSSAFSDLGWQEGADSWGDRPEERLVWRELRSRSDAAIGTLRPAQRAVVILRDIAGWKHRPCNGRRL